MTVSNDADKLHDAAHCPCKKKGCERYRKCDECRQHHAGMKRPCACERVKKKHIWKKC